MQQSMILPVFSFALHHQLLELQEHVFYILAQSPQLQLKLELPLWIDLVIYS